MTASLGTGAAMVREGLRPGESDLNEGADQRLTVLDNRGPQAASVRVAHGQDSWDPVDLTDALNISSESLLPSVGDIGDGRCLLYAGRVNGIAGASGSGKSFTAMVIVAQEVNAGHAVVYIDYEDDEVGMVARLRALGVPDEHMVGEGRRFYYFRPSQAYDMAARRKVERLIDQVSPSLIVIDSTGEALALGNHGMNDDGDVARWFAAMPVPMARRGPAVLLLDHTPKADERGKYPIGSQRKRAAISGAQYMQELAEPFDKVTPGRATITCVKDRHGNFLQGSVVADLVIDNPQGTFALAPGTPSLTRGHEHLLKLKEQVSRVLEDSPAPVTSSDLAAKVGANKSNVLAAAREMAQDGYLERTDGPRGAKLYTSKKPFRVHPLNPSAVLGGEPSLDGDDALADS